MASQSRDVWVLDRNIDGEELSLARMIHEHFCYNCRSAATTSLRPVGSPLGPSTYCRGLAPFFLRLSPSWERDKAPRRRRSQSPGLRTPVSAPLPLPPPYYGGGMGGGPNRHEECGLAILLISIIPIYSNNVTHTVSHCSDRSCLARRTTISLFVLLGRLTRANPGPHLRLVIVQAGMI